MRKCLKAYFFITFFVGLVIFFGSCDKEDIPKKFSSETKTIETKIKSGNLLINYTETETETVLYFEEDTISFPSGVIQSLSMDKDKWKSVLVFKDQSQLIVPTLGDKLHFTTDNITLNPSGYAPLSAIFSYVFPIKGHLKIRIKSKDSFVPDITYLTKDYDYSFIQPVHGLYANFTNKIYISLTNKDGKERVTDSIELRVPPLNMFMPEIRLVKSNPTKMEDGLTLVSYIGDHEYDTPRPFMMDAAGNIRWILSLKRHPQLSYLGASSGLKRLRDGNFLTASIMSGLVFEINMFGEIIKTWDVGSQGYDFHRDIIELPSGNFLLAVTDRNSVNANGIPTVFDTMVELDRESGIVKTKWDFKKSLDENRSVYSDKYSPTDWAHQNAIAYSEKDNSVIVSNRYQGITKLTWNNELRWILSPHKGWQLNGRGEPLAGYLLKPLDASSNSITDQDVMNGNKVAPSFDWSWGAHSPVIMPNGNLLVFDNGYYRHYNKNYLYSRAVEYRIDESRKTIQQVWEFGRELGQDGYSSIVGSVQYLPRTNHILFGSGAIGFTGHGEHAQGGGRIIELDHKTKEIVFEVLMQVPTFYVFHRVQRIPLYPH